MLTKINYSACYEGENGRNDLKIKHVDVVYRAKIHFFDVVENVKKFPKISLRNCLFEKN